MPCVSGNYQKGVGVILDVAVIAPRIVPIITQPQTEHSSPQPLPEGMRLYRGLLDTGATSTCVSSRVADEVGLKADGIREMVSASGTALRKKYIFTLGLSIVERVGLSGQPEAGRIVLLPFPPIEGLEFEKGNATPFDVLVGMDIIGGGSLKIDFDTHFSFCF